MDRWTSGPDGEYDESWPAFTDRVVAALTGLAEAGDSVVVTSGGPIAAITTALLEAPPVTHR